MAGQFPYRAYRPAPRWQVGTVLLALVPLLSLGLLSFVPAAFLAVLRRTVGGWVALVIFAVTTGAEWVLAATAPKSGSSAGLGALALGVMFAAVAHYVICMRRWQRDMPRVPAAPQQYFQPQPQPRPYAQRYPQPWQPPAAAPAPATEDVGAELRRLSERLRDPRDTREPRGPRDGGAAR